MREYVKPTMKSKEPVWELPVIEDVLYGKPDYVHHRAKFHCFVGGESLCYKYSQDTDFFETDTEFGKIKVHPEIACKTCLRKYRQLYSLD